MEVYAAEPRMANREHVVIVVHDYQSGPNIYVAYPGSRIRLESAWKHGLTPIYGFRIKRKTFKYIPRNNIRSHFNNILMLRLTLIAIVGIIMLYIVFSIGSSTFAAFQWPQGSKIMFGFLCCLITFIWAMELPPSRK